MLWITFIKKKIKKNTAFHISSTRIHNPIIILRYAKSTRSLNPTWTREAHTLGSSDLSSNPLVQHAPMHYGMCNPSLRVWHWFYLIWQAGFQSWSLSILFFLISSKQLGLQHVNTNTISQTKPAWQRRAEKRSKNRSASRQRSLATIKRTAD